MRNVKESELDAALVTLATTGARAHAGEFRLVTRGESELHDVSDEVAAIVAEADVATGIALVSVPHTTCAVVINENEPGVHADWRDTLERMAPRDGHYRHDAAPHDEEGEAPNGYAHMRAALLGSPSVLMPVREGKLALGRWQRLFLAELDRSRPRTVQVTVLGVGA